MNKLEAKIIILEDLLASSEYTISSLHNCLTDTETFQYQYSYPEQTIHLLQKLQRTLGPVYICHHSLYNNDCDSCKNHLNHATRLAEAEKILKEE